MKTTTAQDAAALEAMKAELMPHIDEALTTFVTVMNQTMLAASQAETDRCIQAVEMCRSEKAPVAWNEAITFAAAQLRSWKAKAAE